MKHRCGVRLLCYWNCSSRTQCPRLAALAAPRCEGPRIRPRRQRNKPRCSQSAAISVCAPASLRKAAVDRGWTMRLVLLIFSILAFGSVAAFGQPSTVIGSIDRITGSNITVKTPRGSFTIHADDRTETVKDKTHRGLPSLTVGQEISVRCEANGPGKLRAVRIWAKVIAFSATVKHVGDDDIEVVTIPNADYPREENRIVHLHADTVFGTSRDYLSEGQNVRIVGLEVGNEAVDAARIALYNTDLPADTGPRLPHRYSVCPPQRHSLGDVAERTGLRLRHEL